ncbi:hypothetical protein LJB42_003941 [Komagataella kurtzmanii]|nr:hypothetical protein LJB42_003941 [Komagataella kurtzmanii]
MVLTSVRANKSKSVTKPVHTVKKVQSHLRTSLPQQEICPVCKMAYVPYLAQDIKLHDAYHQKVQLGRPWTESWGNVLHVSALAIPQKIQRNSTLVPCKYVEVNIDNKVEVNAAQQVIGIANKCLNAPPECNYWMSDKNRGKVFLCIAENRAIGVVVTESMNDPKVKPHWFIVEKGRVVENQTVKDVLVGISRIYVSPEWRRSGIASQLLKVVCHFSFFGITLKPLQIAWSQPSEYGGKLASKFSGVKHKSGKILIPVYNEHSP